jgi:L-fuculose-phosphate aldolase
MAEHLQPFLKDYDVLLLDHHGSLTLGQTLEEALIKLERLETVAQLYFLARQLGEIVPLPEGEISRLNEIGIRYRKEGAVK